MLPSLVRRSIKSQKSEQRYVASKPQKALGPIIIPLCLAAYTCRTHLYSATTVYPNPSHSSIKSDTLANPWFGTLTLPLRSYWALSGFGFLCSAKLSRRHNSLPETKPLCNFSELTHAPVQFNLHQRGPWFYIIDSLQTGGCNIPSVRSHSECRPFRLPKFPPNTAKWSFTKEEIPMVPVPFCGWNI